MQCKFLPQRLCESRLLALSGRPGASYMQPLGEKYILQSGVQCSDFELTIYHNCPVHGRGEPRRFVGGGLFVYGSLEKSHDQDTTTTMATKKEGYSQQGGWTGETGEQGV